MSEIVTQPEGVLITGPLIDAEGKSRIVSIQNAPSGLWAYAVASGEAGTAEIDSVVAQGDSGNTKTDPAQLVIRLSPLLKGSPLTPSIISGNFSALTLPSNTSVCRMSARRSLLFSKLRTRPVTLSSWIVIPKSGRSNN